MTLKIFLWTASAGAIAVALVASFAERRRSRRRDMDNVGWVPWTLVQVVCVAIAIGSFAFAMKVR